MKILHILSSPRAEGTVRLVLYWLEVAGLAQEVYALSDSPADLTGELRKAAGWFHAESNPPRGKKRYIWMMRRVCAVCRERKPDVVICWSNGLGAFVLLGARAAGVKGLITHAGNPPNWHLRGKAHTVFTTRVTQALDGKMICCSKYVADAFSSSPGAARAILRTVWNCAPAERFRVEAQAARAERTDEIPRLIMVATLEGHKDHATLLRAMPAVLAQLPKAELCLAGDGTLRGKLEALAFELGIAQAVKFLGSRRDVPALLGRSDVFVFSTTDQEGLGTVLVEALAAGLPVVASDVPACREMLENGRWGQLVPANDSKLLAAAIVNTLTGGFHPPDAGELRLFLEKFSTGAMQQQYLRIAGQRAHE